jgi:hypothetical protein
MSLGRDRSCAADAGEVESHRIDRGGGTAGGRCTAKRRQVPRLRASPVGVCSTVDLGDCSRSRSAWSERTPSLVICQWPVWVPRRRAERLPRPRVAIRIGACPAERTAPVAVSAVASPAHSATTRSTRWDRWPARPARTCDRRPSLQLREDGGDQVVDLVVDQGVFSTGNLIPMLLCGVKACVLSGPELAVESGIARGLVPVDAEGASHVSEELRQLHGVPGAAAPARLLEGVRTPVVRV